MRYNVVRPAVHTETDPQFLGCGDPVFQCNPKKQSLTFDFVIHAASLLMEDFGCLDGFQLRRREVITKSELRSVSAGNQT